MSVDKDRLRELSSRYCDGALTVAEASELQQLLRGDESARRLFLEHADVHARLCWEFGAGLPGALEPSAIRRERRRLPAIAWIGVSAAVVFAAIFGVSQWASPPQQEGRSTLVDAEAPIGRASSLPYPEEAQAESLRHHPKPTAARLVASVGVRWRGERSYQVGDPIAAGPLELSWGLAVLETSDGARIILEGASRLDLQSARSARLDYGRVVVRADGPDGFVLDSSQVEVVDKGTEFGVQIAPEGEAVVQVFSGRVQANFKTAAGRSIELTEGQACGVAAEAGSTPQALPFAAERFVRTFPKPAQDDLKKIAFQTRSQVDSVQVAPAPNRVLVDGDLSEWDEGNAFFAEFDPPYGDNYHLRGNMMYDARFLYLAGHVGDPAPMRSVIPPDADDSYCYRGGCVQVRLCGDPAKPWPLPEYYPLRPDRICGIRGKTQRAEFLVHLSMWYYAAGDEPCLQIRYGIGRLKPPEIRPQGWKGAYRKTADRLGYTFEYAIPWSLLLTGTRPFQAGDQTAVCWQVNWADRSGRVRVAQMNECVNASNIRDPLHLIDCWRQSASWGRALFLRTEPGLP